ncbi:hypothetical protein V5799_021843 [Amblyomma americanum]|uniref:THAP-type domain-containing protein n=1 Tax=Amblyomma americanum TaxID=6943 RepID=A0AAQ4FNP2_AMBAM
MAASGSAECTRSKSRSSIYCCVYGCHNSYKNTAGKLPKIKFYSFPWRPYEEERRQRWVRAVRRASPDGSPWQPNRCSTRICSAHFVGNEKSTIAGHPAYIPTLFPASYGRCDGVCSETKIGRYERAQRRGLTTEASTSGKLRTAAEAVGSQSAVSGADGLSAEATAPDEPETTADASSPKAAASGAGGARSSSDSVATMLSVATQTEGSLHQGQCTLFLSVASQGCASTQVCHNDTVDTSVQAQVATESTFAGPEERSCVFLGYESMCHKEEAFRELCGVSANVFALLLSVISPIPVRQIDVPVAQKLAIFLMRLKLGTSFSSIAVLFGLHRTAVSRIFYFVLSNMLAALQNFIPNPSRATVDALMPACFMRHYPRCRFIIDCTEVRTEEPPTLEQRRALFSHYKGGYTLKFLVGILPNGCITFVSDAYGGSNVGHPHHAGVRISGPNRARGCSTC